MSENSNKKPVNFLFVDLETDGTNSKTGNILEVSCILTDNKLNQIGNPFHSLVCPHFLEVCVNDMVPFVREMHTKNGLINDLRKLYESDDLFRVKAGDYRVANVEKNILSWLGDLYPEDVSIPEIRMAGHSINSLDFPFIRVWMPELASNLSHRTLDISSYVRFITDCCEISNEDIPFGLKEAGHRATDDNQMAVREAKKLREWIIKSNQLMKNVDE